MLTVASKLAGFTRPQMRHLLRRVRLTVWRRPKLFLLAAVFLLTILYLLYEIFAVSPLGSHDDTHLAGLSQNSKCSPMSDTTRAAFETFVRRILKTLDLLEVTHFLCYDTLWTALRQASIPKKSRKLRLTDGCFNLCILNEDIMRHDDSLIERRFRNNGITLKYQHGDGIYIMTPSTKIFTDSAVGDATPELHPELFSIHARVHVFEKDAAQDVYRRVGWRNRVLPSTMCTQLHCFPPSLIEKPLPTLELGPSLTVSAPREGVEMQKYHYPESWWTMASSEDDCSNPHRP